MFPLYRLGITPLWNSYRIDLLLPFKTKKGKRNSQAVWVRPWQTSSWWDSFCAGQKVSKEWKEYFLIPQEIFEKLCTMLRPSIQKNKGFRDPVSLKKQVAAALYYLADARQTDTCLKSPIETLEKGMKYFKVNNEDVRTTSMASILRLYS